MASPNATTPSLALRTGGNSMQARPKVGLFDLPRELRDKIYEYTLTESSPVAVQDGLKQPALLFACRQVRKESVNIWYESNKFLVTVTSCEAQLLYGFSRHLKRMRKQYPESKTGKRLAVQIVTNGRPDWSNLMRWCELIHCKRCPAYKVSLAVGDEVAIKAATQMAKECREAGMNWEACKKVLQHMRPLMGKDNQAWLSD